MLAGAEKTFSVRAVMNPTHDPQLRSWVLSANEPTADFPIQNLPLGVFRRAGSTGQLSIGVAVGDQILDLRACCTAGVLDSLSLPLRAAVLEPSLNPLMALAPAEVSALRRWLSETLRAGQEPIASLRLLPMRAAEMQLPV